MESSQSKQGGVNRNHGRAFAQKVAFSLGHLAIVVISGWLVFGQGWTRIGTIFGSEWSLIDPFRAQILVACALLYWLRHAFTLFYLIERMVDWSEALGLLVFIGFFEIGLVLVGGGAFRNHIVELNGLDGLAFTLLIGGSFLNSYSELQRKWWKRNPDHQGHCYTEGLFRTSMHINYFGDTVLFTGWCLLSASLWTLGLPLLMTWMFITIHIPGLDQHLARRYGSEFQSYAAKTRKFVPGIY